MNPLDKEEFAAFTEIMHKEMPLHTPTTAKIPHTYGQLPKNLMDYSAKVDNKFLNNYQHFIEECKARNKENHFIKSFQFYQLDKYDKYGILSKDGFYSTAKRIITSKHRGVWGNLPSFFIMFPGKVNGADLETNQTTGNLGNFGGNIVRAFKLPSGTVGEYYDRVAVSALNSNGNLTLAIYDDSSGDPVNRMGLTSSNAADSAYTWRSVTEFALTTAVNHAAYIASNGTFQCQSTTGPSDSQDGHITGGYGDPADPFGSIDFSNTDQARMKIGHS